MICGGCGLGRAWVDDQLEAQAFTEARGEGYDVVLDFLWGRPTEILLRTLIPASFAFVKPTRLVQAGESAGPALTIAAASLRIEDAWQHPAPRGRRLVVVP